MGWGGVGWGRWVEWGRCIMRRGAIASAWKAPRLGVVGERRGRARSRSHQRRARRHACMHTNHPPPHLVRVAVARDKDQDAVVGFGGVRQDAADLRGELVVHLRLLRLAVDLWQHSSSKNKKSKSKRRMDGVGGGGV